MTSSLMVLPTPIVASSPVTPSTTSRVPSRSCRRRSMLSAPALNATPRARHKSRLLLRPRPRPTPPSPPPRKNTKTKEHKVDFGSRVYSTLTVGKCDTFFSHSSYVTAKASFKTATKAFEHATGAHTQAVTEAKMAVETAKNMRHQCLCKKKKEHETVYSVRHASAAANLKAWVKAHQIICVLDDKTSCRIPAVPTVSRGKIYSDAKEAKC